MYLTKFARKVTIIHRRDELRAAKSIQEKAFKMNDNGNGKLHFMWDSVVEEVGSADGEDGLLNRMIVKNVKTGETTTVELMKKMDYSEYSDSSVQFLTQTYLKILHLRWMNVDTSLQMKT